MKSLVLSWVCGQLFFCKSVCLSIAKKLCVLLPGKRTIFIPVSESESQGKRDSTNKSSLFCVSVDCEGKAHSAEVFIAEVWF